MKLSKLPMNPPINPPINPPMKQPPFRFTITHKDGYARRGIIHTPRGDIHTPAFMPVGTAATVKALYTQQIEECGTDIILANTYHLMLRPGSERMQKLGGIHQFMNWKRPILTDSGGYQVMSLAKFRTITDEGVLFHSHIDGQKYLMTPENVIDMQTMIGSDIHMVLDECVPFPCTKHHADNAVKRTTLWAERSLAHRQKQKEKSVLFAIVQGGIYADLRAMSVEQLVQYEDFTGFAIGGLSVGEGQAHMVETLEKTSPLLPENKPRYLMGVGTPDDLLYAIEKGIDMADCVMPTRLGRHGHVFTKNGKLNLKNAQYKEDPDPIDANSPCPAARDYSKAYLHHLIKANEYLAAMLLSWINIAYYQEFMREMRESIEKKNFAHFAQKTRHQWQS